jgi:hypothetical protein
LSGTWRLFKTHGRAGLGLQPLVKIGLAFDSQKTARRGCRIFSWLTEHSENRDAGKKPGLAEQTAQPAPVEDKKGYNGNQKGQTGPEQSGFVLKFRCATEESRA